jgi:virulence-associated protein VapD
MENMACTLSGSAVQTKSMYAIAFDLNQDKLMAAYPGASYKNAYKEIEACLAKHNFIHQQGSVYFGDMDKVTVVSCIMAVIDLTTACPWFAASVSDVRMLRIEDNNDLMPIILHTVKTSGALLKIVE